MLQPKGTAEAPLQALKDGLATLLQQEAAHTRQMQHHSPNTDGTEQTLEEVSCGLARPRITVQLHKKISCQFSMFCLRQKTGKSRI